MSLVSSTPMTLNRDWIRRVVDSRWFALADLAIVSLSVALLTVQELVITKGLDTALIEDLGHIRIGGWPLAFALIPWGIRLAAGRSPFRRTKLDFPIAIILLAAAIGVWAAYDRDVAWAKFWIIVSGILIYYALAGQPQINQWLLTGILGLGGFCIAVYYLITPSWKAIGFNKLLDDIGIWWMSVRPSLQAQVIQSNAAAAGMAMMAPFILAFGIHAWLERKVILVLFSAAAGGIILFALLLTGSRGAWVALSSAMGIWIFWFLSGVISRLIHRSRSRIFALAMLFLGSFLLLLVLVYPGGIVQLADSLPGPPNAGSRLELARDTFDLIADYPITGAGLRSFPGLHSQYILMIPILSVKHSHNIYLETLLETGPLGLMALIALIVGSGWLLIGKLIQSGISAKDRDIMRGAVFAALIVMSVHGIVDYSHEAAPLMFILLGMAITVTKTNPEQRLGRNNFAQQDFLLDQSVIRITRKTIGVVFILIAAFVIIVYGLRDFLLANWYANMGALQMARVDLAGWAINEVDESQGMTSLDTAESLFHQALQFIPENRTAHHRLGLIAMRRSDFTMSVGHLERAYKQNENHRGIWRALGSSYIWSGRFKQFNNFDEGLSLSQLDKENQVFANWLSTERDPHDWLWLVYEALKAGYEDTANAFLEQQSIGGKTLSMKIVDAARNVSEEFMGNVQSWVGEEDSLSLWNVAVQATNDSRLDDAFLAYHAMQVITGENGVKELALFLWDDIDDKGLAESVLRQAIEVYPSSKFIHAWLLHLGDLMSAQERWDEAQTAYLQSIQKQPENLSVHIGLGWAYYENGDGLEAAMSEFQQEITLYPDNASGYISIGKVLERENRYHEAMPWFERALELNPDCHWCYMHLADYALQVGDLSLALEFYEEAISRFPEFVYAHSQVSWAYHLNEQPQYAIASIEQAMALVNTPEPRMLLRAAEIYERAGEYDETLSLYWHVLEIDPDNEMAKEGLNRLGGSFE